MSGETSARYIYAAYRRLVKNDHVHFGLSLASATRRERAKLSAPADVRRPMGPSSPAGASRERELSVLVPLLGMNLEVALGRSATIGGNIRAVGATIDPRSGSWVEGVGWHQLVHHAQLRNRRAYESQKIIIGKKQTNGNDIRFDQRYEGPGSLVLITF